MSDPSVDDLDSDNKVDGDFLRSIALGIDCSDFGIEILVDPLLETSVSLFFAKSFLPLL